MAAAAAVTGVFDRLLGHNEWATRLLLERCRALTPAQFTQRFNIGPGSLHDTLTHGVHHRAQCLNMLRRLGLDDLPDVDAIDWEIQSRGRG